MTPAEVAALLTAAKALDDRVTPDKARAAAWSAVLDHDLELEAARAALIEHYRVEVRAVMPADINTRWRAEKRRRAEARQSEAMRRELESSQGVPMPPHIRKMIRELGQLGAMKGRQ
jgi:hypothetical protein